MQSGQINASQLLSAFLGSEKDKLGAAITNNDFSGELAKHLPQQVKTAGTTGMDAAKALGTNESNQDSGASAAPPAQGEGATNGAAKIKGMKSTAAAEKSLFVSNPAIVETVLANLRYPAKTRNECVQLLSKQGHISIKDLKSLLNSSPAAAGSSASGEVPAASVRTLMESVVKASGNAGGKASARGQNGKLSVAIKQDGTYSRDELRGLLDKVVQALQKKSPPTKPSLLSSTAAPVVATAQSLKPGQTEELVSTALPSFISSENKVSGKAVFPGNSLEKPPQSQSAKGNTTDSLQVKAVSSGSDSLGDVGAQMSGASLAGNGDSVARATQAVLPGSANGLSATSATGSPPAGEALTDTAAGGFYGVNQLAEGVAMGQTLAQSGSSSSAQASGVDSLKDVEARAEVVGQDAPMVGKQIEKMVGGTDHSSRSGVVQATGANPDGNQINLPQMNNSGEGGFAFYDRNRKAEQVQSASDAGKTGASAASGSGEGIANVFVSYMSQNDKSASTQGAVTRESDNQTSTEQSSPIDGSGKSLVGELAAKAGVQAAADKVILLNGDAGGAKAVIETAINGVQQMSSTDSLAQQEAVTMPSDAMNQSSQTDKGQSSGSSPQNSATGSESVKELTDRLTAIEQYLFSMQGGAVAQKLKSSAGSSAGAQSEVPSASVKGAPVADPGKTAGSFAVDSGAGNGPSTASAASGSLARQVAVTMPVDLTGQGVQSGQGQSVNASLDNNASGSVSTKTGTDTLRPMEQLVVAGQGGAAAAKRIDETSESKDLSPGSAMAQASASNLQTINMSPADNSPQGGFAGYDPYRAVELANNVSEQAASAGGGRLVLDMVSDGLGKVNLKVEAKKGEISVEALTQNEPARQALVNHSVELRQDLKNQGLVLGKFMVDVNGGGQGGKNSADANQYGGKGKGGYQPAMAAAAVKASDAPIQAAAMSGQSRINIFA